MHTQRVERKGPGFPVEFYLHHQSLRGALQVPLSFLVPGWSSESLDRDP